MPVSQLLCEGRNNSPDVRVPGKLLAFAGKDLLWAMNNWCLDNGFIGAWAFREKILTGIQRTTDEIETWLQEWGNLKEIISRI